ncbi:MAG: site-2 protease family protein, partial [Clostridiales bacterium]|nr:site-2 protease family protein [Clostridiales bacterium]
MTKLRISPLVFLFALVMLFFRQGVALIGYTVAVVLHEMAHAEVARRRGYALTQVKIMPYGASLTGKFEGAGWKDEVRIAAAGPLMNLILAVLCVALWWLLPVTYFFTETFVIACVCTALSNLLPVFPLDGGRVFLAVMSCRVPRERAYKVVRLLG